MSDTVNVRIAVTVDSDGRWHAAGAEDWTDERARNFAMEAFFDEDTVVTHMVTATVPVPAAPVEVEASE